MKVGDNQQICFLQGLWGGMIAGIGLQTLLLLLVLYKINWSKEVSVINGT